MLKSNCTCGKYSNDKPKGPTNLFSFAKPRTSSILDDEIPDVYSVDDYQQDEGTAAYLKEIYPHIDDEIIVNFPFEKPRMGQLEIIQDINDAIRKGYKYIILEAGTGTGKSAIATTLAKMYESAYILTMTKQLQAQYSNEFAFPLVKGRGNFACLNENLETTCDMGACKTTPTSSKFFCPYGVAKNPTLDAELAFEDSFGGTVFYQSDAHCHYWNQKANAVNSPITLMNYDYAIVELNYVKHFGKRSLLILDEAHNIENKLMSTMEVTIYNRTIEKDIHKTMTKELLEDGELEDWIMEVDAIRDAYEDIDLKDVSKNKADRIRSTIGRLKSLKNNLENEPKNWVIDTDETSVVFKPLRVHHYAKNNLLKYGDVVIFMSATILSHKMFSKWLGLNPKEVYHIKVDSPFTKEKRPIILNLEERCLPTGLSKQLQRQFLFCRKFLKSMRATRALYTLTATSASSTSQTTSTIQGWCHTLRKTVSRYSISLKRMKIRWFWFHRQ